MKVLRFKGRDIVRVKTAAGYQGFYRSTGRHSANFGQWYPFDGILIENGRGVWFDKHRFVTFGTSDSQVKREWLNRCGNHLMHAVSLILGMMSIPEGEEANEKEVNKFLNYD